MKRLSASTIGVVAAGLLMAPTAGAAVQIGETLDPTNACSGGVTFLQAGSPGSLYAAPSAGVITSWSFQADASTPQVKFKVGRAAGGSNFLIVGESALETPEANELNVFPTRIPVQPGDVIGFYLDDSADCSLAAQSGYSFASNFSDVPPGSAPAFIITPPPTAKLDVSATLEPDADNDGFGDETQDACPTDASKQLECVPPTTTITKGPRDKTRKRTATFEFTGADVRAVAAFECSLDGAPFAACISPHTVKVKKGKHIFQVRATDGAGNTGAPATDTWKRKKKRKKK
jgi:hypothetical protein